MTKEEVLRSLAVQTDSKLLMVVIDGLGGLPVRGKTELEAARIPNLDRLTSKSACGLIDPISYGITPGSGPAHLALFGYDPLQYEIGRGVLESVGVGLQVHRGDVAARGNFVTLDPAGNIADRRAGRISSGEAYPLVERLKEIRLPGVETEVRQVKEYRFAVVMRGENLNGDIDDTDPQQTGVPPLPAVARTPGAEPTAELFNRWIAKACELLADSPK